MTAPDSPDALIAIWQDRLAAITCNANELSDAETTKRIRIKARQGLYCGETKVQADAAVAQLCTLVEDYVLLAQVVDQAIRANQGGLFTSRDARHAKVSALLLGASIARAAGDVPIQHRTLLGAATAQDRLSPEQLLTRMQQAFVDARDTFDQIDQAEHTMAQVLASLQDDYARIQARAEHLRATVDRPPLIDLPLRQSDPLSAVAGIEALKRNLKTWADRLEQIEAVQQEAQADLLQTAALLDEVRQLVSQQETEAVQLRDVLGSAALLGLSSIEPSQYALLDQWQQTLAHHFATGQWRAVQVGAQKLNLALHEARTTAQQGLAELRLHAKDLADVSGSYEALKAKQHLLRVRNPTAAMDTGLVEEIQRKLQARPLDLAAVRDLLKIFQSQLNAH